MSIDIDSFLEKYNSESKSENNNKKEQQKENYDFQKDVEDKLIKTENKVKSDAKFEILEKIYDEIKKFDEDIPSKFLGIENKANIALKTIGDKYSKEFLLRIKQNVSVMNSKIQEQFQILDSKLNTTDFQLIIRDYESLLKLIETYPKEFLKEKNKFSIELRKREILINKKINDYKTFKLKEIKLEINNSILNLNKSLIPGNISEIEGRIFHLHTVLKTIPKIFLTEMTNEKIMISKILIQAENYLEKEYEIDFNKKEENIFKLFEKFHTTYINKNLSKALILYDEVLLEFESLPEVFFEKKMAIYDKINNLYSMINDLFIKNNLSILLQSYNVSQVFKETNDYLAHIETSSKLNIETLLKLESKINLLPEKTEPEKSNILKKINLIKLSYSKSKELNNLNKIENKDSQQDLFLENISTADKNNNIREILTEINSRFNVIKKSNTASEIKLNYKKIIFYLDSINFKGNERKEIIHKLNKVLMEKNIKL